MKAKTKLPYDVPFETYEVLKDDAERLEMPATQLLIKLIEDNHNKQNIKHSVDNNINYASIFKTMTLAQREAMFAYGAQCREIADDEFIKLSMELIRIIQEEKRQILKDRE